MKRTTRRVTLRSESIRALAMPELTRVNAGYQATGDACKSVNPCPGEYTWFCSP